MLKNDLLDQWDRENFFHPSTHLAQHARGDSPSRVIKTASGVYIEDRDGHKLLGAFAGLYCVNAGYGRQEITDAIAAQAKELAYYHSYVGHGTEASITLSKMILDRAPANMSKVYFGLGGSDANETNIKLIWYYNNILGRPEKKKIISRMRAYHGVTIASASLTGLPWVHNDFDLPIANVLHTSCPHYYRHGQEGETEEQFAARMAQDLEDMILREGPETIAAFVFEPVVGAAGGCVPAPDGYAKLVREICTKYGVLMISDEVMCGAGRTGTWRALAYDGVEPDIMSVAKGLAAGYVPLGAAICTTAVWEVIRAKDGAFGTGHTFTGHTAACAAGVAVQKIIARDGLLAKVAANGDRLKGWMADALAGVDSIGDIRGRGHFICAELVADRATKAPYDAARQLHLKVRAQAMENGLICYPVGGNVDGSAGDIVILAPPYNCTDDELTEIVDKTARSIRQVLAAEGLG